MGFATTYLTKAEVQDLLGITSFGMWRLPRQHPDFPAPAKNVHHRSVDDPDAQHWDATAVYVWAATTPQFRQRGALLERPLPDRPGTGRFLGHRDTAHGPATDWDTAVGVVRLLHTTERGAAAGMAGDLAAERDHGLTVVCSLFGDIAHGGPALVAADTARPRIEYEADWSVVVQLAGQPLPWWPGALRRPDVIRQWSPGAEVLTVQLPADDREVALQRAMRNPAFTVRARAVLTDMARSIRNDRIDAVRSENMIFGEARPWHTSSPLVIAAEPDTQQHPLGVAEEDGPLRPGWAEVARSNQPDAVAALHVALGRNADLLPYGSFTDLRVSDSATVDRWVRRLALCDPTAGHATLAEGKQVEAFFTDPLTDMPVVRTKEEDPSRAQWLFYAPRSLPAGRGELASVVLDGTAWITTTDGLVHPAPCLPDEHLWWGDGWGDRATELAHVVHLLLDDLSARIPAHRHWQDAPSGLTALFNAQPKSGPGTELGRAALLHARMTPVPTGY
ncbi:hypothetical protein ACFV6F_27685 [Kitasatospora phosalacinea]|uniref:hypothetical protein n=1 Tax=Kitasatospora phosalacinea TaxID=2065 RepID=UPI003656C79F